MFQREGNKRDDDCTCVRMWGAAPLSKVDGLHSSPILCVKIKINCFVFCFGVSETFYHWCRTIHAFTYLYPLLPFFTFHSQLVFLSLAKIGKDPKEGGWGVVGSGKCIFNPKINIVYFGHFWDHFLKKLQYDFPKMRMEEEGAKGGLELLQKFIRFGTVTRL